MSKPKTCYSCQSCGTAFAKWQGKCHVCHSWNSIAEEIISGAPRTNQPASQPLDPVKLSHLSFDETHRIICTDTELNRVLGGGIVPGSLILLGGEPGIGKSTLLLQMALSFKHLNVLYVSGEESLQQIKLRAQRLENPAQECYLLQETALENVIQALEELKPNLLIIDSIQTLYSSQLESAMGTVGQIRACAASLMQYAKTHQLPIFLIGHITKEGTLAGPKLLEHMVDTVLQFEGDTHLMHRLLRTTKNRFGATSEIGIYTMEAQGLTPVHDPSSFLRSPHNAPTSGTALAVALEGNRNLLIEVQALVGGNAYGTPQRSTTGFDTKRLNMLLAVLEKKAGLKLSTRDVFLNIAGGLTIKDPALDLAACMAIASSYLDQPIPTNHCFMGEVGLSGELRGIVRINHRIQEALRLGIQKIYPPTTHLDKDIEKKHQPACHGIEQIGQLTYHLFHSPKK